MIGGLLVTINSWMSGAAGLAALGCFLWGVVSVILSPCHLASIPLIVSYVAGQEKVLHVRSAVLYALTFTLGLFITIALVGVICALLGRMLGDVGSWWTILVGVILLWVSLDMLGIHSLSMSGSLMARLRVRGIGGAFLLGLAYGVLSGSCTFGFMAPILAIVTVQQEVLAGSLMMLLFALGHCLPIAIAGSSTALVRRLTESSTWQGAGLWFRRGAGVLIAGLGVYFILQPFMNGRA